MEAELTDAGTVEFRKGEKTGNENQNQPWPVFSLLPDLFPLSSVQAGLC